MGKNLLDKVWAAHSVRELPSGQTELFIGLHLVHEVTSPQAFQMMRELPDRQAADHAVRQVRRQLGHAPAAALRTKPAPFAREWDQDLVFAAVAPEPCKATRQDVAFTPSHHSVRRAGARYTVLLEAELWQHFGSAEAVKAALRALIDASRHVRRAG